MVVDDSAVIRGLISRMLEESESISVIVTAANGQMAIDNLAKNDIDVVILDIEMPVMDGLTALPKLLEVDPDVVIIVASTLTARNAGISLRALEAGATDYVPKPTASREISGGDSFRRELLKKVKSLGEVRRRRRPPIAAPGAAKVPAGASSSTLPPVATPIALRGPGKVRPDILAIGSSTGGPQALFALLKCLKPEIRLPVIIAQHMPATFTTVLAQHISRISGWPCTEAKDGEPLVWGHIYLAPGDYHMTVEAEGAKRVIRLNQEPPENFCRPAVDPMFRSAAKVFGGRVLGVVLTGMGSDGTKGGKLIANAGGTIIAQDEATSVVWGMPGAAAVAGICSAVLPIGELAPYIMKFANRGA